MTWLGYASTTCFNNINSHNHVLPVLQPQPCATESAFASLRKQWPREAVGSSARGVAGRGGSQTMKAVVKTRPSRHRCALGRKTRRDAERRWRAGCRARSSARAIAQKGQWIARSTENELIEQWWWKKGGWGARCRRN